MIKVENKIVHEAQPAFAKPAVIASLLGFVRRLICRDKPVVEYKNGMNEAFTKKYTIVNPDEYDKEYGLTVEIGLYTVEEYYYIKGYWKGQQAYQLLHPNSL